MGGHRPDGKKKAYVRLTADHDALDVANKVRNSSRVSSLSDGSADRFHLDLGSTCSVAWELFVVMMKYHFSFCSVRTCTLFCLQRPVPASCLSASHVFSSAFCAFCRLCLC